MTSITPFFVILAFPLASLAGPLQEATVNRIVNDVRLVDPAKGAHTAKVSDRVGGRTGVRTGVQSRAELLFPDQTLTRLGAETFFSFQDGTRDLRLDQGTLLLQVPKGLGGTRVRAASVTASITGTTIMIEHLPGQTLKVAVLEGSLRLALDNRLGEAVRLTPGKMILMKPDARALPEPVDVDIRTMVKTSSLINPEKFNAGEKKGRTASVGRPGAIRRLSAPLPSIGLINQAIVVQDQTKGKKGLLESNLVILGKGAKLTVADDDLLARLDDVANSDPTSTKAGSDRAGKPGRTFFGQRKGNGKGKVADERSKAEPKGLKGSKGSSKGGGDLDEDDGNNSGGDNDRDDEREGNDDDQKNRLPAPPAAKVLVAGSMPNLQLTAKGANGLGSKPPRTGGWIELRGSSINVNPGTINGVDVSGGNAVPAKNQQGGNGGRLDLGTSSRPIPGQIVVEALILATTGTNSPGIPFGGTGGTINMVSNEKITIKSRVQVSEESGAKASRAGGNIFITSRFNGTAIAVENSAELLSLLGNSAPGVGGIVRLQAPNGKIEIKDSTLRASRGTVDMQSGTTAISGDILLQNATLRADTIKVGALGPNGQLRIGGGTLEAATLLKLYAPGSNGSVQFTDNVTLSGNGAKHIAGKTVEISGGKTVTIGGTTKASVFTDNGKYDAASGGNGSGGSFGGAGAQTRAFSDPSKPAF